MSDDANDGTASLNSDSAEIVQSEKSDFKAPEDLGLVDNYERDEDDELSVGANYKRPFCSERDKQLCPSGWFSLLDLTENEDALGRFMQPKFNACSIRNSVMVCVPLAHWTDSVNTERWLGDNYHPSMKDITIDMVLKQVVLIGKAIGHVRRVWHGKKELMNFVRWHTQSLDSSGNGTPSSREGDVAASGYTSEDTIESQDTDEEGDEKD
eukprot:5492597-Ditylum_brightwellii.AAC.1